MWPLIARRTRQPRASGTRNRSFRTQLMALEDRNCPSGGALQWSETLPTGAVSSVSATAVQPDGKILTVGNAGGSMAVTRLNSNGTLDTSFNGTGTATIRPRWYSGGQGYAVALQPNGQIVVGGYCAVASTGTDAQYLVARLNTDGSLDRTFADKGYFLYNPTTYQECVSTLAVLPNGNILAGSIQPTSATDASFSAFELTASGAWNTGFGSGGVARVHVGAAGNVYGMAVVPGTGQIVLAGGAKVQAVDYGCVVMLTAGGQADASFHGTGTMLTADSSVFYGVAVQGTTGSGYQLVAGGYVPQTSTSPYYATVSRYSLSGALDTSFGVTGTGILTIRSHLFRSLALEADGSIVLGDKQRYVAADGTTHDQLAIGHLSADGVLDTAFGANGTGFSYAQVGANSSGYSVAIDPLTGDIVLGGFTGDTLGTVKGAALARFSHP